MDKAREAIVSGAENHCPTCHRGFESGEQEEISDTLYRQAASLRRLAARDTEEAGKLRLRRHRGADTPESLGQDWPLAEIQQSLVRAEDRATERLEALKNVQERHRELAARFDGSAAPTEADWRRPAPCASACAICETPVRTLRHLAREHTDRAKLASELVEELEDLAGVSYDAEAHGEKKREKARLDESRGRVTELERRLETRPEVEQTLEEARRVGREAMRQAEVREKVAALGFDEGAYEAAGSGSPRPGSWRRS